MGEIHSLLKRQIRKYFGDQLPVQREWHTFLQAVDKAYMEFDSDRTMLERSLELSSQEHLQVTAQMLKVREMALGIESRMTLSDVLTFVVESATDIPGICFVLVQRLDESGQFIIMPYYSRVRDEGLLKLLTAAGFSVEHYPGKHSTSGKLRFELAKMRVAQDYMLNPRTIVIERVSEALDGAWPKTLCDSIQKILSVKRLIITPLLIEGKSWGNLLFFLDGHVPQDTLEMITAHCTLGIKNMITLESLQNRNIELANINRVAKQAEQAVRESEEKYRIVVENATEGMMIALDGMLKFANRRTAELTGYSQEELTSRPFTEFIHPDDRHMVIERRRQRLKGIGLPRSYALRIVCKPGDVRWVELSVVIINWEGRPGTLSFMTDITDRKRLEEEEQRVEKLESVGLLAGGIAHDFNNILTAILGNITLARMEAAPGSEIQESLEQAEKASLRAKDLTGQLLTFSKGGAPVKKLASLTELLRDTAGFALRGSNVKCRFSIPDDLWHAEIDAGQVSQAIHNLVINAQQAMPAGGTIELRAENMALTEKQSLGKGLPLTEGNYLRIAMTDHGSGIAEENLARIFDPFFTTKQKGSGLGLATSFSIARQHGGHISVESEPGSGSTFYLYLPASTAKSTPGQDKKEQIRAAGKARILVMDDEKGVREVAGRMLKRIGYEDVEFAADGAEAIKLYKAAMKSGKPFSVAILDLTIAGGMGGIMTMRELLKIDPGVKAIVSSGYTDKSVMAEYKEYGFSGMVAKPYTFEQLGKAVQDVIG